MTYTNPMATKAYVDVATNTVVSNALIAGTDWNELFVRSLCSTLLLFTGITIVCLIPYLSMLHKDEWQSSPWVLRIGSLLMAALGFLFATVIIMGGIGVLVGAITITGY